MSQNLANQIIEFIEHDTWMIDVLNSVRNLKLDDCWIGAGFVRNKVWDEKHGKSRTKLNDIDIIYFNKAKSTKAHDTRIENDLKKSYPNHNWSVKNQSRMHIRNGHKPYANCNEAISFWPETATAVAVRLSLKNQIEYIAPYGLEDLFNLVVIPTPSFDLKIYKNRIEEKRWQEKWNNLEIETCHKN